jgi:hypothetical protein
VRMLVPPMDARVGAAIATAAEEEATTRAEVKWRTGGPPVGAWVCGSAGRTARGENHWAATLPLQAF